MPYLVLERLFLGDIEDTAEVLQNGSKEITHVLSALSSTSVSSFTEWRGEISIPRKEIRKVYFGSSEYGDDSCDSSNNPMCSENVLYLLEHAGKDLKLTRMAVPLIDMESQNLLDYLEVCLDFIDKARKEGSVLVHCFAGVSRSASIVTAYLMRTLRLSQEDALQRLRQSSKNVNPNEGFLKQLKMFEEMGFKVDQSSSIYKRFRLKVLGDSYERGEKIDSSKFEADPALLPALRVSSTKVKSKSTTKKGGVSSCAYSCKKCRRVLALEKNVLDHVPGDTSFQRHRRKTDRFTKSGEVECSSIFVEPLRWMKTVEEGAKEGKLFCIHCEARLGHFSWSGIQCSCGSWITPGFQIQKSKVETSTI